MNDSTPMQPLIGGTALGEAAEAMLAASRALTAAASTGPGIGANDTRSREMTADAVEAGVLRALRRDSLLGDSASGGAAATSLFGLPTSRGIPGTSYGRMGATLTGQGAKSQVYGTIGGALGFAVGGPLGAFVGGMLGGLIGDDGGDNGADQARQQEQLAQQWLNTPEGFEGEAYLYNLVLGSRPSAFGGLTSAAASSAGASSARVSANSVVVNFSPGAVQITGGADAGERAARAFAGELGRVLRLNSVVVPAAGWGDV
jgi:hypothetical protein